MSEDYDDEDVEWVEEIEETADDIRKIIRDEIEAVLRNIPGEGSVTDVKKDLPDDDEPLTLRALESSVRRIVEEAMIPLRDSKPKPKPKPKPRKEPETEPEPGPIKPARSKLTTFLWGEE